MAECEYAELEGDHDSMVGLDVDGSLEGDLNSIIDELESDQYSRIHEVVLDEADSEYLHFPRINEPPRVNVGVSRRRLSSLPVSHRTVCSSVGNTMKVIDFTASAADRILENNRRSILTSRGVAIAVANETKELQLKNATIYFFSGTSESCLPDTLNTETVMLYTAQRLNGFRALGFPTGVVGCICYDIINHSNNNADGAKLAIMFSVPFVSLLFSNWWNVKIYTKHEVQRNMAFNSGASKDMYKDLYYSTPAPYKGDNNRYEYQLMDGFKAQGFMTNTEKAKLIISIYKP